MGKIIALLLVSYAAQAAAQNYLQRFMVVPPRSDAAAYERAQTVLGRAQKIVARYPWLAELQQPTATLTRANILHRFDKRFRVAGLPFEFRSHESTVLNYADGMEVSHLRVAESTINYEHFRRRLGRSPAVVRVRDRDGLVKGEYIYTERDLSVFRQVFSRDGFSFEDFLAKVESPLVNVAAGGARFAWLLSALSSKRGRPSEQRRSAEVFSLDISGAYNTFTSNPWYLFGNLYATGLPDNTFGAVITLGGPQKRRSCPRHECVRALRELGRIARPRGRLLIEYSMPTTVMFAALEASDLKYLDFLTYEGREHTWRDSSRPTRLIEILLAKDM